MAFTMLWEWIRTRPICTLLIHSAITASIHVVRIRIQHFLLPVISVILNKDKCYYVATIQLDCTCTFILKSTIPYNVILMYNVSISC
ncbi:hypothetical protein NP493_74g05054 [Ridgeia piscesae]|uniref:Uncharacterized protein n=1 Tax=Ridgeia piscesae TaxID=27915 RepID=A0AAD9UIB9_RIDPI|nr:hypothetical protein NP493_74g05054 [Ridgeia piscesae]